MKKEKSKILAKSSNLITLEVTLLKQASFIKLIFIYILFLPTLAEEIYASLEKTKKEEPQQVP